MLLRQAVAAAVAVLVAPGAGAAYLQTGGDAARTGVIDGQGPVFGDLSFRVELPGHPARAPPIWTDRGLMVLVADLQGSASTQGRNETGVFLVNTSTASVLKHIELPPYRSFPQAVYNGPTNPADIVQYVMPPTWASDGQRLFISTDVGFAAYNVSTGEPAWPAPFVWDIMEGGQHWMQCVPPAVQDGSLFVACDIHGPVHRQAPQQPDPAPAFLWSTDLVVARIDAETGEPVWTWRRPAAEQGGDMCDTELGSACHNPDEGSVIGMSVVEGRVVVLNFPYGTRAVASLALGNSGCGGPQYPRSEYWGIDAATGSVATDWVIDETTESDDPQGWNFATGYPSGARGDLFLLMDSHFVVVDPQTREVRARIEVGQDDPRRFVVGSGLTVPGPGEAIVSTAKSLYRVDLDARSLDPARALFKFQATPNTFFATQPLHHGGGLVYAVVVTTEDCASSSKYRTALVGIDVERGQEAWRHDLPVADVKGTLSSFVAFTGGNAAWVTNNGTLLVLGRTPASIQPVIDWSTASPQPNETVTLDLSRSAPGIFGAPGRFHVDWGDGTRSGWQEDPRFTHTYREGGAYTAVVSMENSAGQASSEAVRVLVAPAPAVEETAALPSVMPQQGLAWWWIVAAVIGAVLLTTAVALVLHVVQRPAYEKRYRVAVRRALDAGDEPTSVLRPLREAWGISETQHARIVAEEREAAGEGPASARLAAGALFLERYRVLSRIGAGSQGRAYLCEDEKTGRRVVIKAARAAPEAQRHIMREAKAFAKIRSPYLVRMIDVDAVGRDVFLVLEHAGEGNLHHALTAGPLASDDALALAETVYGALQALHGQRLVHGDISPHNVFGSPRIGFVVGDLGLSRNEGHATALPGAGTPGYLAPEVASGSDHTVASDLYAAARLVVAALTGDPGGAGKLADRLQSWARKAAHPDPGHRYADARAAWLAFQQASAAEQQQ